jgi:hypothetical protein
VLIRTVLDARRTAGRKYAMQTSLLAASWCHHVKGGSGHSLERSLVIGETSPALTRFLTSCGATVTSTKPHEHDRFSRYANKLLGVQMAGEAPILLVDNDTCFVADLGDIGAGPDIQVMAGVAGDARVSPAQWEHIERHLRIKPLDFEWCPLKSRWPPSRWGAAPISTRSLREQRCGAAGESTRVRSCVGGAHQANCRGAFDGHPLKTPSVHAFLDQTGLATAIGTWGRFALLDDGLNYRPRCFWMGEEGRRGHPPRTHDRDGPGGYRPRGHGGGGGSHVLGSARPIRHRAA